MNIPADDPLQPHSHEPNPEPPSDDPAFILSRPDGVETTVTVAGLEQLPYTAVANCYIVSTGHGPSGPFTLGGARLLDLVEQVLPPGLAWSQVEVISADGFGNRILAAGLRRPDPAGPILLGYNRDGQRLTRRQGLVRLIVPSEKKDALRQVKWVRRVNIRS